MAQQYLVNKNIKKILEAEDKKQSDVVDRAGIKRDVFSRIIHCRRLVYADEVVPIANAMGVSIDALFEVPA